jgi:hypothetical protein
MQIISKIEHRISESKWVSIIISHSFKCFHILRKHNYSSSWPILGIVILIQVLNNGPATYPKNDKVGERQRRPANRLKVTDDGHVGRSQVDSHGP